MSLPNIPPRSFISYPSSQDRCQSAEQPASVNDGGTHLREQATPAVVDFLNNLGLDATNHSMDAAYPGDRPIPKNEEWRLMERFSDLLDTMKTTRADRNKNIVDDAPAVRSPVTLDNRIPPEPRPAATNSNPQAFPNVWIIG